MRTSHALLLSALALALAGPAPAGELYLSGQLAISTGTGESGGATPFFPNTGSDSDSSPAYGGALGFSFSPREVLPEQSWLPKAAVRFEFEGVGGRDYEFLTVGADPYYTQVSSWSFMNNLWVDVPLDRAIAWAFGRIPVLEPLYAYGGAGVGFTSTEAKTTDNVSFGMDDKIGFSWQAGAGLGYALTEFVSLQLGYRYQDLGDFELALFAPQPFGTYTLDLAAHEFTSAVKVNFFRVPLPGWRSE